MIKVNLLDILELQSIARKLLNGCRPVCMILHGKTPQTGHLNQQSFMASHSSKPKALNHAIIGITSIRQS